MAKKPVKKHKKLGGTKLQRGSGALKRDMTLLRDVGLKRDVGLSEE